MLATGGYDKKIMIFDVATGGLQRVILQADVVCAVTFSPDAMIVGDYRGKINVYELDSYAYSKNIRFKLERGGLVSRVAVSPGGHLLAVVSGIVKWTKVALFSSITGELLRRGAVPSNP